MNSAFEDAFYQLDSDRDGVVTMTDLRRYVRDNNLKDKFIQKWLTLFGDEKNVIYYDKFCETMGIVPVVDKFEQKTYKLDMTEETRKLVTETINDFLLNDKEWNIDTLDTINSKLSNLLGGTWMVKIDPTKTDLNVDYASDGLLYYSPSITEKPKILVYRELPDIQSEKVFKKDMSDETQAAVQDIVSQHKNNKGNLNPNNMDDIVNAMERDLGDKWGIVLNPSLEQLNVSYEDDGILYYSLDETESPKILVWRKPIQTDVFQPQTYKVDMSDQTMKVVVDTIEEFRKKDIDLVDDTRHAINRQLSRLLGDKWRMNLNPTKTDLNVKYSKDGLLYYSPSRTEHPKILVYREEKELTNGEGKEIIYEEDMSDSVKHGVLEIVRRNFSDNIDKSPKVEIIIKELNDKYGQTWNILLNPDKKNLQVVYDFDGKIYFSPNSKENVKMLIWRQDKEKTRGRMCFCCF